ncbi:MAG TPA: alkaline phosphatase family protein [Terriglobia bacterium]|nr:alkaline phosphatase family protein [Terriglobia bacterium]
MRKAVTLSLVTLLLAGITLKPATVGAAGRGRASGVREVAVKTAAAATPIQHVVVIFQENVSFDHYFGTYPIAANPTGQPPFTALLGTPSVNGLNTGLLTNNPNFLNATNGAGAANPFRLDRSQNYTNDQDHAYTAEQSAFDAGLMDSFPAFTGTAGPPPNPPPGTVTTTGLVMGYYDGNTVTALWNYAQHFALNDNFYGTTFGPSTPGALNLISGQTNGVVATLNGTGDQVDGGDGTLTMVGDADPIGDECSSPTRNQGTMGGDNIGTMLTSIGVTWGSFMGGFNLSIVNPNGTTGCSRSTTSPITGINTADYIPHHAWFQYYAATANPKHTRPANVMTIGHPGDPANNEYDIKDFFAAVNAGNFPAVSFLKAPAIQDGHAGYSSPLDEQAFLATTLNYLQQRPEWSSTMVVVTWDDSDGWYDHQMGPIVNQSAGAADTLTGPGFCGNANNSLPGYVAANLHATGRCGYGPRIPVVVISPYAKPNFVDHTLTDQASVLRFIEDNWLSGQRIQGSFDALAGTLNNMLDFNQTPNPVLLLNTSTGEPK